MLSNSTLLFTGAPMPRSMVISAPSAPIACSLHAFRTKPLLFMSPAPPNKLRLVASPDSPNLPATSFAASAAAGGITQIDESQFSDTVLRSDLPVLVEFVANWCGPCRLISPAMEAIAQEYSDKLLVVKIDHDKNPKLIEEFKVYGLPTLILFKNGKEVPESRREGAITKAKLKVYVDALLNSISVA